MVGGCGGSRLRRSINGVSNVEKPPKKPKHSTTKQANVSVHMATILRVRASRCAARRMHAEAAARAAFGAACALGFRVVEVRVAVVEAESHRDVVTLQRAARGDQAPAPLGCARDGMGGAAPARRRR